MQHHLLIKAKTNAKSSRAENQEIASIDLQSIATSESRSLGPELRFCTDISKLKNSVNKGTIKESGKVFERIGRLKQRYSSITKYYDIKVIQDETTQKVIDVTWIKKLTRQERNVLAGCYVIETTHKELAAK